MQSRSPVLSSVNYDCVPSLELASHLSVNTYGNFTLTDAVRPSTNLTVIPQQGYRKTIFQDGACLAMPLITASVTSEKLLDVFFDLLDPVGNFVDIILETSHWHKRNRHSDCSREQIDLPILKSFLCNFEDLILNDGCTGIAVFNAVEELEVQLDEHKLIYIYANSLRRFERILKNYGIVCNNRMPLLTDAEHIHTTRDEYMQRFCELRMKLSIE
jgi:hypothetical protein